MNSARMFLSHAHKVWSTVRDWAIFVWRANLTENRAGEKKCVQHYRDVQDEKRLKHSLDELALKIELPLQPLGIPNLFNKCYMNSLLQIICWTPLITSQLAKQLQRQGERKGKMSMSILRLLDHHYSTSGKRTVDKGIAENIIMAARHAYPQFEGNDQEDDFEMFNTILSTIEEEARQNFEIIDEETGQGDEESFRNLPVSRLFGGEIVTIWSYDSCKCEDRNTQRFTSIPLTVIEDTEENDFNVCEHGQSVKDEFEIYQTENVNGEPADIGQDTRDPHEGNPDKRKNEENEVVPQEPETNQVQAIENEEKKVVPQESETNQGGTTENEVVPGGSRTDQRECTENDKGHSVNKYTDVEKGLHQMLSSVEEFDEELLGCRRCEPDRQKNGKARGIKRVSIAPPVLVLQLNRAVINEATGKLEKFERKLTYPEVFDLAPFCETDTKEPVLYSLYGIVNHIGSISSGHYFAYIKTKNRNVNFVLEHLEGSSRDKLDQVDKDSEWYCVSDTTVKQRKEDNALNSGGAYILMYERTDKRQE